MKRFACVTKYVLPAGLAGLVCLSSPLAQGANLSISPSSITNDFKGTIVLSITGLTPGKTVAVEQYMNPTGSGMINSAQDALVQAFTVSDGSVTSIAEVRNLNVPGDDDGLTNGQIRVELPYPGLDDTLTRIAGNYLFRMYDPVGGFTPVTNSFTIAQKVYPQGVTGKVTGAGTGLPLANAVVVMVVQNGPGFGAIADAGGNFTLYSTPGDYSLLAAQNGSVGDQGTGGVTVGSNAFVIKNLTNLVANRTISGQVSDSASGLGLPGIFIQAETIDNLFSLAFSDASGNFTLPVTPTAGDWKVKINRESGVTQLGYLTVNNTMRTNVTSGSVSNLNFQFAPATALIYGTVKDNLSNVIAGLALNASDFSYTYDAGGKTDANGNYAIGVFASSWNIGPDNQGLAAANLIGQGANVSVTNGQAWRQDFTLQHVGAHLRGRVVDTTGSPLDNMMLIVQLFSTQGPSPTTLSPQTQGDGTFDAGVSAGHWTIALECGGASGRGVVSPILDFTVVDGVDQTNIILIAQPATVQVSGVVHDNNGTPISAQLYAFTMVNGTNYNACGGNTDAGGNYHLALFTGNWQVGISGDLTSRGYDNPQNQNVNVSGAGSITANIVVYPLGQTPPTLMTYGYGNGHFQFRLNGDSGQKYRIETTTNLQNPASWVILRTNTAFGGAFDFTDTNSLPAPPRFYRAVLVP